jgi:hypothetical protein
METFFLAETKAGAGLRTETEAGVTLAAETFGIVGTVAETETETEAGMTLAVEIFVIVGIVGAKAEIGVAFGMEAFSSCARLNKNSM